MAQQADVARIKRDLDAKISKLDVSKTQLQEAVAGANQSLEKANTIITQQRREIQALSQARADLKDQVTTLKEDDLLEVQGHIDQTQHAVSLVTQQVAKVNQEVQSVREEAQGRDAAMRSVLTQLQEQLARQEDVVGEQTKSIGEIRRSLLDFQHVLTVLRKGVMEQGGQVRDTRDQLDELSRRQLDEAKLTAANWKDVKESVNTVVSAMEKVTLTVTDRLDTQERRLVQISRTAQAGAALKTDVVHQSEQVHHLAKTVTQLRNALDLTAQKIGTRVEAHEQELAQLTKKGDVSVSHPVLSARLSPNADPPVSQTPVAGPLPSTSMPVETLDSETEAYQRSYGQLRAGSLNEARQGFARFIQTFPRSRLASNAQYWLAECYYGQGQFARSIQEFEQVMTRYPQSSKVPAALLKIGYSHLRLHDAEMARAVFRQLVRTYPKSPEASKAYARLMEVDQKDKSAS